MKAKVIVDAGICGFQTRIHADSEDSQNVMLIVSGCEKARAFGEDIVSQGPIDAYAELGAGRDGVVLGTAPQTPPGLSARLYCF